MPREENLSLLTRITRGKISYFWWTILLIGMACATVCSWLFFLHTFNYPEIPKNYKRLEMLGRLPEVPNYDPLNAPDGLPQHPEELYNSFISLDEESIDSLNTHLLRIYIQNFKETQLNRYVQGEFQVKHVRELTEEDFITNGIVVYARALREIDGQSDPVPYLLGLKMILPGAPASTLNAYPTGMVFELFKNPNFTSIIHVHNDKLTNDEQRVIITTLPLVYKNKITSASGEKITIQAPKKVNIDRPFPIR